MPDLLTELKHAIGDTATEALLARYGGVHLRVPKKARHDHPIGHVIGTEEFAKLVAVFGDELLSLPSRHRERLDHRNAVIIWQRQSGASIERLARDYDLTTRQIFNILARHRSLAA